MWHNNQHLAQLAAVEHEARLAEAERIRLRQYARDETSGEQSSLMRYLRVGLRSLRHHTLGEGTPYFSMHQ